MSPSLTVFGYDFKDRRYCDECLREPAKQGAVTAGVATMWGDCGSTEDILHEWAFALGIDRDDETSFDSAEFPKRIHEHQAHEQCTPAAAHTRSWCEDRCEGCGAPLGHSCPTINDVFP